MTRLSKLPHYAAVQKSIEEFGQVTDKISWDDFMSVCSEKGVETEREALELADALEMVGVLVRVYCENSVTFIHLKPKMLAAELHKLVGPEPSSETKEHLEEEYARLAATAEEVERKVSTSSNVKLSVLALTYTSVIGAFARLTWWELSWDIMEPVTYFVTMTTAIGCVYYVVLSGREFSHEGVLETWRNETRHNLYKKMEFDENRYNFLKSRLCK